MSNELDRAGGWPQDDVGLRSVLADEIQVHRRQFGERDAAIARKGDGLEKRLWQDDRRSTVQVDTALEPRDVRDEISKIAQTPLADGGARC